MELSADQRTRLIALLAMTTALSAVEEKEKDFLSEFAKESGEWDAIEAEAAESSKEEEETGKKEESKETPKTSHLSTARALVASKTKLQTANSTLTKENGTLKAENSRLTKELAEITAERDSLLTERDKIQSELDEAKENEKSLNEAMKDELASIGTPEKDLPGKASSEPNTIESLQDKMKETDDPREKGVLAKQIKDLRNKMN